MCIAHSEICISILVFTTVCNPWPLAILWSVLCVLKPTFCRAGMDRCIYKEKPKKEMHLFLQHLDISRFLDMHKYRSGDLFEKVIEQMKEGGCVH